MLLVIAVGAFAFSEIMYDWPGSDSGTGFSHEWVELVNCSSAAVEITDDFRFSDGSNHLIADPIKGNRSISSNGVFVLASDAKTATSTFFVDYPSFSGTSFDTAMSLNNTSDTLEFRGEAGTVLASVTYQSSWGGQGSGKSIEKENPCDGNPNSGWRESSAVGGTPGNAVLSMAATPIPSPSPSPTPSPTPTPIPTSVSTPLPTPIVGGSTSNNYVSTPTPSPLPLSSSTSKPSPTLKQTENPTPTSVLGVAPTAAVVPSSSPTPSASFSSLASRPPILNEILPSPTGPDIETEYIELFNPADIALDLSGWFLDDGEGGSAPYQFPSNTIIPPKGYLVFTSAQTKIALNNSGDSARLLDEKKAQRESVAYGKAEEGFAYGKNAAGQWRWTKLPTPGGANTFVAASAPKATASKKTNSRDTAQNKPEPTVESALPSPFVVDLNKILPSPQSLTAELVSSDTRILVLAASIAVSFGLLLVFTRRFF